MNQIPTIIHPQYNKIEKKIIKNKTDEKVSHHEKARIQSKKFYDENREKILSYKKEHYTYNKEKKQEYYQKKKEEILEKRKLEYQKKKIKIKINNICHQNSEHLVQTNLERIKN